MFKPPKAVPRFFAPVLAILLVIVAGCAQVKPEVPPKYSGTLVLYAAPGLAGYPWSEAPALSWFEERARAYEQANAGTTVQVRPFPSQQELETALRSDTQQPAPDLTFGRYLPELAPRLADILPVMPSAAVSDLLPGAAASFQSRKSMVGLPILLEVQVLALNERAFEAAGVSLPANGTWSQTEFETSLEKLSAEGLHGLGFYHLPGHREWYPLAGLLFSPSGDADPGAASGLERLQKYRKQGWLHPDTAKLPPEQTWKLFAANPPAFAVMPAGTWALPLLKNEPYNVKLFVAAFPGGKTTGQAYGFSFFAQSDKLKLQAAVDLALFMAAPDQQIRLARATGLMPASRRVANPFEGDTAMTRAFQSAPGQSPLPSGAAWDRAESDIARELHLALVGGITPAEAVKAATAHLSEAATPAPK